MKTKSKILGIVLVLVMVVSMLPSVGITYAAPDTSATYTVDTSATQTQAVSDYHYEQAGATLTADGYTLSATNGDFDARVWVNGCSLGNQVHNGGLTVSFTACLPQTNEGAVYYCYSAEQNNAETYPFVGFKPVSNGYRLLNNMVNGNDTFYNDTIYTGSVPVILYITSDQFELYVDGEYIATVDAESSLSLGERWFFGFKSFWAGNTNTTLTVTDLKYLNGKAILQDGGVVATEAPSTQAPVTEVPTVTEEPDVTEAPTVTQAPSTFSWSADFENSYNQVQDGQISYDASTGHYMKKSGTQSGFCSIFWADSFDSADHTVPYTLTFTAKQQGGYAGNTWDGYAIAIRHQGGASDTELFRLVPSAAGVDLYVNGPSGTKVKSIYDNNEHTYRVTFDAQNNQITSIKVDGMEVLTSPVAWTVPSSYHGIMVKSGHNDATGVELWLTELGITQGEEDEAPATGTPSQTAAPSQTSAPNMTIWTADLANAYNQVQDGEISYDASTGLHLMKSGTQTGFCSILWCDNFDNADHDVPYTLRFTAKQTGGYAGNTWDGYAVSIRNSGGSSDTELIRLVPSAAGVDVYVGGSSGTKVKSIYDENAHTYDVTFDDANNQITSIKVDGVEALSSPVAWTAPPSYHGIMIKSGHNDATGVQLYLTEMSIIAGETEEVIPGATEVPTEAPSQDPTEAPTQPPAPVQATVSASLSANGGVLNGLVGSTTVAVAANATVTSQNDLNAVLAIIVYDSEGKIVNIAYEGLTIDADVSPSVTKALEAGFNLPSTIEGYKIRIAVYDNLSSLNQLASVSYTIE